MYIYLYSIYIYTHHLYTNWIEAIWMNYISYILKPNFRCEIDVAHPTSVLPGSLERPGQVTLQGTNISPFKRHFLKMIFLWWERLKIPWGYMVMVGNGHFQSFLHKLDPKKLLHSKHRWQNIKLQNWNPMCLIVATHVYHSVYHFLHNYHVTSRNHL